MYNAPSRFTDRLSREFDGRFRIRWSVQKHEWHIEYKVARGKSHLIHAKSNDDNLIRAREGYAFAMAIQQGDRMPCPRCGYELKVPCFKFGEVKCDYCAISGRPSRVAASYFPLDGDMLIQELIKLDPMRAYRDGMAQKADAFNDAKIKGMERKFANQSEDIIKDKFTQIAGIQSVGYSGREAMWTPSTQNKGKQ